MRFVRGDDVRSIVREHGPLAPRARGAHRRPGRCRTRRRARERARPPRREARQRAARSRRPRLPVGLRPQQARPLAQRRDALRPLGRARWTTSRPSRSAASGRTRAPTSTRSAASCTSRSPARAPYPLEGDEAKLWAHLTEPPPRASDHIPGLSPEFDDRDRARDGEASGWPIPVGRRSGPRRPGGGRTRDAGAARAGGRRRRRRARGNTDRERLDGRRPRRGPHRRPAPGPLAPVATPRTRRRSRRAGRGRRRAEHQRRRAASPRGRCVDLDTDRFGPDPGEARHAHGRERRPRGTAAEQHRRRQRDRACHQLLRQARRAARRADGQTARAGVRRSASAAATSQSGWAAHGSRSARRRRCTGWTPPPAAGSRGSRWCTVPRASASGTVRCGSA